MGEIKFFGSLMLIALFTIAVVGYSIGFAQDNNAPVNIADDNDLVGLQGGINSNLEDTSSDLNSSSAGFFKVNIQSGSGTGTDTGNTETGGAFKLGIRQMSNTMKSITNVARNKIFGSALGVFLTALISFLTFVAIRYVWKTWKGGNPD